MYSDFPLHIASLLKQQLPGVNSHLKMIPPGRDITLQYSDRNKAIHSSILFLLFPFQGEIYTCLTKRNIAMKNHPGQVSFPGGKIEKGESPELTALRETKEEVGVSPLNVKILGMLSELYIPVSNFNIFPYVGWMEFKPKFILNEYEAEKLLLFPISRFQEDQPISYIEMKTITGPLTVPYYSFEEEIIWGATAMILSEFFDLLKKNPIIHQ